MRYAHEVGNVRKAERALMARLPDGALMQRAAAGLASICAGLLPAVYGSRVVLLVGGGDNGGDALYAGARLARRGARVRAVRAGSKIHEAGLAALRSAGGRLLDGEAEAAIADADLIIDGLTGIGGSGGLREPHASLAAHASTAAGTVVACDVPSGVDAGTGRVEGAAVHADVTVTFGTYKPGLLIDPGASHCGVVELVDIGLGDDLPDPDVVAPWPEDVRPPEPGSESDKYRRGVVGILAGGDAFTGAAVLSTGGAVHGGAGMVRFASVAHPVELVRHRWPEAVTTVIDPGGSPGRDVLDAVGRVQAWVVGPGLGTGDAAESLLTAALATDLPVLVDADGLTVLARRRDLLLRSAPTVLTPHAGELSRLIGAGREAIEAARLEHVRRAAAELDATVLLKGSTTLVAEPDRPVRVNPTGTPRLATAGTGDVLSGLIGALLAGGMPALDAAAAGAYLHGLAARLAAAPDPARRGESPISAHDVIRALPEAFRTVARSS
ncbi:NAD(P)H-hydrate dehydratase [Actinomadura fibrosa]|uniref:Bifunctional NAD(P)H-hydrate repair enzyme n=1 Tax=Actinomadura fibrosa TaxID=111802 RepID=A0ABW2XLC9_9ACTN|nr:NAD(P)H-hydrate dehydratase [Actinomadura fibrosa]